jgi:hypothetical protein
VSVPSLKQICAVAEYTCRLYVTFGSFYARGQSSVKNALNINFSRSPVKNALFTAVTQKEEEEVTLINQIAPLSFSFFATDDDCMHASRAGKRQNVSSNSRAMHFLSGH